MLLAYIHKNAGPSYSPPTDRPLTAPVYTDDACQSRRSGTGRLGQLPWSCQTCSTDAGHIQHARMHDQLSSTPCCCIAAAVQACIQSSMMSADQPEPCLNTPPWSGLHHALQSTSVKGDCGRQPSAASSRMHVQHAGMLQHMQQGS